LRVRGEGLGPSTTAIRRAGPPPAAARGRSRRPRGGEMGHGGGERRRRLLRGGGKWRNMDVVDGAGDGDPGAGAGGERRAGQVRFAGIAGMPHTTKVSLPGGASGRRSPRELAEAQRTARVGRCGWHRAAAADGPKLAAGAGQRGAVHHIRGAGRGRNLQRRRTRESLVAIGRDPGD